MLASPLFLHSGGDRKSSRLPTASGRREEASAKRTQADLRERKEPGNLIKSSVFKHADPSNLGRSLLGGNQDHLLHKAR